MIRPLSVELFRPAFRREEIVEMELGECAYVQACLHACACMCVCARAYMFAPTCACVRESFVCVSARARVYD